MGKLTLKDLSVKHDYYASDNNYYSKDARIRYDRWEDFYENFKDADIDLNLIYRWDIKEREEENQNSGYCMEIFIIGQRKGKYIPIYINFVEEKNVEEISAFLKPHFEKLVSIWNPLNNLN